MGLSREILAALSVLHYACPLAVFLYFIAASLWSILTLQTLDINVRKKLRNFVCIMSFSISMLYACEAGTIIYQIFHDRGHYARTQNNIYVIASSLVWLVMINSLMSSSRHQWYPYYGAWIFAWAVDVIASGLDSGLVFPKTSPELTQMALRGVRLIVMAALLALFFALRNSDFTEDEEETALLKPTPGQSPDSQKSNYGSIDSNTTKVDSEADEMEKKLKEGIERLEGKLKQHGNWFTYLKEFSILAPHLWPKNKPLLVLNMTGVALCLLGLRALTVLIPLQLGVITNDLSLGYAKEAFISLLIYFVLQGLNSNAGLWMIQSLLWLPVSANQSRQLDTAAYNHIMNLSCDFHDQKRSGELYTAMKQGSSITELIQVFLYEIAPLVMDLLVACLYFYFLFDAYLVLIGVAAIIAYTGVSMRFTANFQALRRRANAASRQKEQTMYDTLGSWRTVSYLNRISHAQKLYNAGVDIYWRATNKLYRFWYLRYGVEELVLHISGLAAFAYGTYDVLYGGNNVGSFVALVTFWSSFTGQLRPVSSIQRRFLQQLVDAEELLQLFQTKATVEDGPNEFFFHSGLVEFDQVSFGYKEGNVIIHDLSFHARPGQTIAIVGETGAGKSTILKLLFRFYDVLSGSISIDGQELRDVTLSSLRDCLGVVPQDPTLFNDTIMANVRYAKLEATDEEIQEACKAAAIHDKIMTFKDAYETKVGERGIKLSGGELQRIAIARAILKDPKIILLDEATSSVDSETESKIQEALHRLTKKRTSFVVAHRLSTIQNADRVLVVKDGTIVEQGTLKQLMKSKGKYYNLWIKQIGLFDGTSQQDGEANQHGQKQSSKGQPGIDGRRNSISKKDSAATAKASDSHGKASQFDGQTESSSQAIKAEKLATITETEASSLNSGKQPMQKSSGSRSGRTSRSNSLSNSNAVNKAQKKDGSSKGQNSEIGDEMQKASQNSSAATRKPSGTAPSHKGKSSGPLPTNMVTTTSTTLTKVGENTGSTVSGARSRKDSLGTKPSMPAMIRSNPDHNHASSDSIKVGWEPASSTSTAYFSASEGKGELDSSIRDANNAAIDHGTDAEGTKSLSLRDPPAEDGKVIVDKDLIDFSRDPGNENSKDVRESLTTPLAGGEREVETKVKTPRKLSQDEMSQPARKIRKVPHFELPPDNKALPSLISNEQRKAIDPAKQRTTSGPGQRMVPNGEDRTDTKEVPERSGARPSKGKKGSKLKASAAPFVPSSHQRKGQKTSDVFESTLTVLEHGHSGVHQPLMQQAGNVSQDIASRRQLARSEPTGQSLKSLQDKWIRGTNGSGEQVFDPETISLLQVQNSAPLSSGNLASRNGPLGASGSNRRRSRFNWKKDRTTSDTMTTSTSEVFADQGSSPIPTTPAPPHPTPTGVLTPVGESPGTGSAGSAGIRFVPETK